MRPDSKIGWSISMAGFIAERIQRCLREEYIKKEDGRPTMGTVEVVML